MDASTLMDWRNAVIAIDLKRISAILSINQTIVSAPLMDIPSDIQIPVKLGSPSEMSALQYTLLTMWSYNTSMSPNEKQLTKARKQLVDLLLQTSLASDLDYQNDHGDTTLHFAAALDLADIAASIVARGASTDLKNRDNATPESLVASANTRTVLEAAIKQRPAIKALRQNSLVSNSVFKQNLQNTGNSRMAKTRIPEYSSKDRFTELRRLAESSATGSDQRTVTKKDISNYIQPGMLEQKKKGLSMEEVQREERIRQAKRRAEVEQLVTKKVVNTSRFVTERSKSTPYIATATPDQHVSPSTTTADGSERKFSALKEKSYVSTSVFRQQSAESDDAEERSPTSIFPDADDVIHDEQLIHLKIGDQHIYEAGSNAMSEDLGEEEEYEEASIAEEPEAYYNEEEDMNEDYVSTEEYENVAEQEENDVEVDMVEDNVTEDIESHGDSLDDDIKEEAEEVEPSVTEPVEDTITDLPEEAEDFRQPKVTERNIRDSVPYPIKLLGLDDNDPEALNAAFQRIIITPAQDIAEESDRFDHETTLLRPRSYSGSSAVSNNSIVHDVEPAVSDTATQWDTGVMTLESSMTKVDPQDNKFHSASNDDDDQFISDTASILDISFPSSRLNFDDDVISFKSFDDQAKSSSSFLDKTLPQKPERDYFGSISVARTSTYTRKASTDSDRPSLSSLETKSTARSGSGASPSGSDLRIDTGSITFSKSTGLTDLPISKAIRRKPIGLVPEKTKSEVIPRSQERSTSRQGSYLIDDDDVPLSATSKSPPALKSQEGKPSLRSIRPQVSHLRGKLLVRICRFNVEPTLIMPKEPFHLRCILTDGKNEYQSQYTQLGNEIDINQGCLISAFPDMKFRLSLQARSDAYVKPKKQLTRLLSTAARKQSNTVLNLVNKDDGHFGQTRIQLRSIAHLCRNSLYTAAFDCYNNWSAISKAGSKANAVRDNLVVVGNLVLQLYFIPFVDGVRLPNTVKECEAGLDIKRWYNTSWLSGEICVMKPEQDETWRKRYAKLIGAHLYIHRDIHDIQQECIDLTTVKVVTADRQVIAKATRKPEAGKRTSRLADFITSEDIIDEEDDQLYCDDPLAFRCTFKDDTTMDILCDVSMARDRWLKAIKGVMNKAPSIPGWLAQDLSSI
ncbi:hypothetical protein BC943DRAFT_351849 [Umbelopsis sp. AD052]|nr:hypothetical protein BC943DRAFT_351849 [Umbelopsis sp. AD052]